MSELKIASDLRRTADYLREHGWCQNALHDEQGGACLVGAFWMVRVHNYVAVKEALGFDGRSWDMIAWNNDPGRTVEEVLDRLESVALALEVRALAEESKATTEHVVNAEALGV